MSKQHAFEIGGYWIGRVGGSANWYRFWYDRAAREIRRRSLGVTDLGQAKIELAAIVLKEGSGGATEPKNAPLIAVLTKYWEERTDHQRDPALPRRAGLKLLDFLGSDARVGSFTRKKQSEFMRRLLSEGLSVG